MFYALILSALGPFIINTFLIDWSFMPDQAKYLRQTQSLRYLDFYQSEKYSVYVPSLIFSFFPLPFVETINSIGFFNKGILGVFSILLFKQKYINKIYFYFINFLPSIFLYSSLSLKDTLSLVCSLIIAINIIHHRGYFLNIISICLVFFIKMANVAVFLIVFYTYNFFILQRRRNLNLLILVFLLLALIFNFNEVLNFVNKFRRGFYFETYNNFEGFMTIGFDFTFFKIVFISLGNFILSPIMNLDSSLKLYQVIENIFMYFLLLIQFIKLYEFEKKKAIFWLCSLIVSLIIYGLFIFDDGTIARYRYVILVFFNFVLYQEYKNVKKTN